MTLQQHIDELRAELEWNEDPAEIRQIKAELEAALAVGAVAGRFVASALRRRSGPPAFSEGSIFTPAEDRNRST